MRRKGDMMEPSSEAGKYSCELDGVSGLNGERLANREHT